MAYQRIAGNRVKPRSFEEFVKHVEEKAPRRKPVRVQKDNMVGTMFAKRNKRITIREAALRQKLIVITYEKVNGEVKKYILAPYSYRFKMLKMGRRKMLFAQDRNDERGSQEIKSFVLNNIRNVALTDRSFVPKWRIEI